MHSQLLIHTVDKQNLSHCDDQGFRDFQQKNSQFPSLVFEKAKIPGIYPKIPTSKLLLEKAVFYFNFEHN